MSQSKKHARKETSSTQPLQPLLTIADVCRMFQISRPTLDALIDQGLPYMKFGRAVRFSPTSLQGWLARRELIA
jgi:excisionase family DNA binding protein